MSILHWLKVKILWEDRNDEKMKRLLKKYWPRIVKTILVIVIFILFIICLGLDTKQKVDRMDRETQEFLDQWR
jgi:hypothetical protein